MLRVFSANRLFLHFLFFSWNSSLLYVLKSFAIFTNMFSSSFSYRQRIDPSKPDSDNFEMHLPEEGSTRQGLEGHPYCGHHPIGGVVLCRQVNNQKNKNIPYKKKLVLLCRQLLRVPSLEAQLCGCTWRPLLQRVSLHVRLLRDADLLLPGPPAALPARLHGLGNASADD